MGSIEIIHGDTAQDRVDMLCLGKKQELRRNVSFVSILRFISGYMVGTSQRTNGSQFADPLLLRQHRRSCLCLSSSFEQTVASVGLC